MKQIAGDTPQGAVALGADPPVDQTLAQVDAMIEIARRDRERLTKLQEQIEAEQKFQPPL